MKTPPFMRGQSPDDILYRNYTSFLKRQRMLFWPYGWYDASFIRSLLIQRDDYVVFSTEEERAQIASLTIALEQVLSRASHRRLLFILGMLTLVSKQFYTQQVRRLKQKKPLLPLSVLITRLHTVWRRSEQVADDAKFLPEFVKKILHRLLEYFLKVVI